MDKALLVGINHYKSPGNNLNGCINDVTNMFNILVGTFNFDKTNIKIMTDERATTDNILYGLGWLIKDVKQGDKLLFHYSGHGSQIIDIHGDELNDNKDELICPYDIDWESKYISDDKLHDIFSTIPKGVHLEVILDCCHSGTGTREMEAIHSLPQHLSFKPRYLSPPVEVEYRDDNRDMKIKRLGKNIREGREDVNHILFAACRDNQTSADAFLGGKYNGAFTYYLCKHLRESCGNINRLELLKRVRASLKFNGFSQVPQLEGSEIDKGKNLLEFVE